MSMFDIHNLNIIQDDENYYFFRALNLGDENDIRTHLTTTFDGTLEKVRTDRSRYEGVAKYQEGAPLSLEQAFDHIKMHHRKDTNCISLSSNANVALLYGKSFYRNHYAMIKVPKTELGNNTVLAGPYMLEEVSKKIEEYRKSPNLDEVTKYYLDAIQNAKNKARIEELLKTIKEKKTYDDVFQKGLIFAQDKRTDLGDYSDSEKENLEREKILAMLKVIPDEILPNASNLFLIQTIGNAFSASELLHDGEITKEELLTPPSELVEVFASLQQLPKNTPHVEELKREILQAVTKNDSLFPCFTHENDNLPEEHDSIKKMYELTKSGTSYHEAITMYHKLFYLAKSRLRNLHTVKILKEITKDNPKYKGIIEQISKEGFGIEPEIFSRAKGNGLSVSENVRVGITPKEQEMFEKVKNYSEEELRHVLQNPQEVFLEFLDKQYQISENEYYANAVIDLFDWESIGVVPFSIQRREQLVQKLLESDVVGTYQMLRSQGTSEKEIVGKLLTAIIKDKKIDELNEEEQFTKDDLDDFLGYYLIKGTSNFKLKAYQAYAYQEAERIMDEHQFASVVMPTGSGKSFVAIATLLKNPNQKMLYLAPNDEIINQVKKYLVQYVTGTTSSKTTEQLIQERFPNLRFARYHDLVSMKQDEIIHFKYDYVILDELHRSGASEWSRKLQKLVDYQHDNPNFHMLGITATEERDMDGKDMAEFWAKYFNYSDEEIARNKHVAYYMSLEDAVYYRYVLNPKKVACDYFLATKEGQGLFQELEEKMKEVEEVTGNDENVKRLAAKLDHLRRNVTKAKGTGDIICENVRFGKKYIVFCPVTAGTVTAEDEDGNIIDSRVSGTEAIEHQQKQMIQYFQDYFGISEEEAKQSIECYSMLGEYSKSKNTYEFEQFQKDTSDSPNKIKFMFVMNKLNEGVHLDKIDGIIWLRPLDQNSRILYLQQLGRIIHTMDSNHPISEENLPIAIDLVGNSLRVKLHKNTKQKDSLEDLKTIQGWILEHDNKIPDINSNDQLEARYASKLQMIRKEYQKYITGESSIETLKPRMRYRVEEILSIGSRFALWNYEFPKRTKQTREQSTLDVDDELFEVQGYLKDFFDIATELDSYEISAFQKNYQQAMAYYVEHGDLAVNTKSGSLGKWIQTQRTNYKNHKLSGEQFEALNAIGMIWDAEKNPLAVETLCEENGIPSEELWRELLSREINDKSEIEKKMKGNNTIPISILELQAKIAYMKDKDISLIQPDGTLHPVLTMNSNELKITTGMNLIELEHRYIENPKPVIDNMLKIKIDAFGDNYRQAQAYYEEHGNLNITQTSGSLGQWIANQRTNYKNHKLSEEQFEALNAIGMIWDAEKNPLAVENLCEENGISSEELWRELLSREINGKSEIEKQMNGNNTIPISILELQAKIAYMKDKDISLIQPDGTLHPILTMNSNELKSAIGMNLIELEHRYIENPKPVIDNVLKIKIDAFGDNYRQAQAYYEEHGNLDIKLTSGSLGSWIQKQRTNYKKQKLSGEQFEALNAIGMIWATAENQIAVETLCEENGISSEELWRKLLSRESKDESEIEKKMKGKNTILISILELQAKIAYMKDQNISLIQPDGTLHPVLTMNSNELKITTGMNLIELEHRYIENPKPVIDNMLKIKIDAFGDNYRQAQAYYEEHGNLNITQTFGSLGIWISIQRTNYKNQKLSREQFEALNAIGMIWATAENQIAVETLCEENGISSEQLWRELLSREINDKSEIEKKMKGKNTIPISILELQAKIAYMKDKHIPFVQSDGTLHPILTMNSNELKSAIGMNLIELEHRYIENPKPVIDNMLKIKIDAFGGNYRQAQAYYEEHGDLNITQTSGSLGTWIVNQRINYKNHKLSEERFEALNAIGMIWNTEKNPLAVETLCEENGIPSEQLWRELLSREINDKSEIEKKMKGNNTIPISILELQAKIAYMKDKHIPFVQSDGTLHPILTMNSNELKSAIGMNLIELEHQYIENPRKVIDEMLNQEMDPFRTSYEQARTYYVEHGNLTVNTMSGSLGSWIRTQRTNYKNQKLSGEQFEALNAIGMIWATAENQIAVETLCEENGISSEQLWRELLSREINDKSEIEKKMKGNNTIPISILELQAKIEYLKDKDISLIQSDGTLHPILTMNSNELKSTTGMSLIELEHRYIKDSKQVIDEILNQQIDSFQMNYEQARVYYEEHGNLVINVSSGSLGAWIKDQRKHYKKQKLTNEQFEALNAIGMIWATAENQMAVETLCEENDISSEELWRRLLSREINDKSEIEKKMKGKNTIPISILELQAKIAYMKDKHIPFVQSDGTLHPILTMNSNELKSAIGMNLIELEHRYIENPKPVIDNMLKIKIDAFGDNYRQAQAYYEEHGNLNITRTSGSLGKWISIQRTNYKNLKLTGEQFEALNAIGMIWEPRKNKEQIEAICASHGITLDKKSPLYKKSATELRCKMAYLESIDVPVFEQDGESQKLNPIFFMSDADMQEKFHVSMSDLVHVYGKQEGVTK